ncbi:MAG: LEPR-XLL domain-containing protein [Planctomycetota bacterium]|jgi:hypothetical protein
MLRRNRRRPAPAAKTPRRSFVFETLEQRVLLSADPFLLAGMLDADADIDRFVRSSIASEMLHDEVEVHIDAPTIRPPAFVVTGHHTDIDARPTFDFDREPAATDPNPDPDPVASESDLTTATDGVLVIERDELVDDKADIEAVDDRPALLDTGASVEDVSADEVDTVIDGIDIQSDAPQSVEPDALVLPAPEGIEQGLDFALTDLTLIPSEDAASSGDVFVVDPTGEFEQVEVIDASHLAPVGGSAVSESGSRLHIDPLAGLLHL